MEFKRNVWIPQICLNDIPTARLAEKISGSSLHQWFRLLLFENFLLKFSIVLLLI